MDQSHQTRRSERKREQSGRPGGLTRKVEYFLGYRPAPAGVYKSLQNKAFGESMMWLKRLICSGLRGVDSTGADLTTTQSFSRKDHVMASQNDTAQSVNVQGRAHNFKDITGQRFGMWTVLAYEGSKQWLCRCDCGTTRRVSSSNLKSGHSTRCAFHTRRHLVEAHKRKAHPREFDAWRKLQERCLNPNNRDYCLYGGRGITVCTAWLAPDGFDAFLRDMGPRPSSKHSIDRIDNNAGYSPENCRWATIFGQARNRRTNRLHLFRGELKTLPEWSEITGIPIACLASRMHRKWTVDKALTVPSKGRKSRRA